ncbi:group III truncated hemoglobin [Microbacterium sp. ASV49]|uniref:Group III truncated hemoglobin n=1 Tax=Microbacterium candidum TaxID=3041922 RepID=A0ABT7N1V8_9MICO|nr:group III truncated hemoglobin [Microbacterium sp. ASV49]MDL9980679.1 group III truncated hemoglobin [Microbacterium sp. ASV49]
MDDIAGRTDIEEHIVAFYRAAFADALLGPIFTDVARLDLERHLPIMADFWETVLFRAGKYQRNALQVHYVLNARHPLEAEHFERWLELWTATLDARFHGPIAERAKLQADRIAGSLQRRLSGESGSEFVSLSRRPES